MVRAFGRIACGAAILAAGILPNASAAPRSTADSSFDDWFGDESGWEHNVIVNGVNSPPTGNWGFEYKHTFNRLPPPGWTTGATHPKPPAEEWNSSSNLEQELTTTSPAGSTDTSSWRAVHYKLAPRIYVGSGRSKSAANAQSPDRTAHTRTRVTDPWVIYKPSPNPDPLDRWSILGHTAMWGELIYGAGGGAEMDYSTAVLLEGETVPTEVIRVSVSNLGASVWADPRLTLFADGNVLTVQQVAAELNSYFAAGGWAINPIDFDLESYNFLNPAHNAQVFDLGWSMELPGTITTATISTSHASAADAAANVPEPAVAATVTAMLLMARRRPGQQEM
jgi:hypothetical protein